jgi:hypothetical protein
VDDILNTIHIPNSNSTTSTDTPCHLHNLTDFCHPCLQKWIDCEIEEYHPENSKSQSHLQPHCPGGIISRCKFPLPYHIIQALSTPTTFAKYDENLLAACLASIPGMQRCLAKTTVGTVIAGNEDDDEEGESTCGNMQEHIGGTDVPIMTCGKCGGKTCVVCQVEMQLGVACHGAEEIAEGCEVEKEEDAGEDNDKDEQEALKQLELKLQEQKQREKEIELSESWLKEHAKQCPGCASWIQKTEGCDHMSCHSKCRAEFCYACLVPYDRIRKYGNHYHGVNCPHYSAYM